MKSNNRTINLGTTSRAMGLLSTHYGVDQLHVQRVVDDPIRRRQVGLALKGELTISPTKEEWIEREENILLRLQECGLPIPEPDDKRYEFRGKYGLRATLEAAWGDGRSAHCFYIPANLDRLTLINVCKGIGVKVRDTIRDDYFPSEILKTEAGVITHDPTTLMRPTDATFRPFMLSYKDQVIWANDQGGSDICSIEEALYLIVRGFMEMGLAPFINSRIRCRNGDTRTSESNCSWSVGFLLSEGLTFAPLPRSDKAPDWGAVPLRFTTMNQV